MRKSDRTSTSEHVRLKFVLAGSLSLGFSVGLLDNSSLFKNPKHKPESASAHYNNNNNNTAERVGIQQEGKGRGGNGRKDRKEAKRGKGIHEEPQNAAASDELM